MLRPDQTLVADDTSTNAHVYLSLEHVPDTCHVFQSQGVVGLLTPSSTHFTTIERLIADGAFFEKVGGRIVDRWVPENTLD